MEFLACKDLQDVEGNTDSYAKSLPDPHKLKFQRTMTEVSGFSVQVSASMFLFADT
jgi:hypothetical protein